MHFTPAQRALRLIIFSIGFILFVVIAFRGGGQATNPQMVNGKPFLARLSQSAGLAPQTAALGESLVASRAAIATPRPAPSAAHTAAGTERSAAPAATTAVANGAVHGKKLGQEQGAATTLTGPKHPLDILHDL